MGICTLAAIYQRSTFNGSLSNCFLYHIVCNGIANLHIQIQLYIHVLQILHKNIQIGSCISCCQLTVCASALNRAACSPSRNTQSQVNRSIYLHILCCEADCSIERIICGLHQCEFSSIFQLHLSFTCTVHTGPYAVIRCKICIFTGLGNGSRQIWRTAVAKNIFTSCKWPDQLIIKLLGAS